jgi:hypothetical protein
MRCLTAGFLLFAMTPYVGGDEHKPNTLTPEEIRAGWIFLFNGEGLFGWKSQLGGPGASVGVTTNGIAELKGPAQLTTTGRFSDFELRLQAMLVQGVARLTLEGETTIQRHDMLGPGAARWKNYSVKAEPELGPVPIRLEVGKLDLWRARDIRLRPLNMKPLFNGKDLTGWKIFPGKKSKFAVENGAIAITNGPGDLQSEGKYKDFILQLECKSNGKHLNSGVFFRCRAGEYQNGYEAQIRNQFTAEPKQVYTIEEYDPKTHKLVGKKKVKSTAVDYGTGAIYRRQPARREVARDGEWFTMTILAHGNHFATWVNGIQVTDWTDNRPPSDNARTGFRREGGHISFQGHDPTTNLSFRNIRIAELK